MFSPFIVWYLFLAGVGSGAFLVAVATMVGHRRRSRVHTNVHAHAAASDMPQGSGIRSRRPRFGLELRQGRYPSASHIRSTTALATSALATVAATLCLLADFGDPLVAWRVVLTPLASITSFGAVVVISFTALAALAALTALLQFRLPHWLFATLHVLGALAALGTMLYAGFLLAAIVSVDLWHTWLVPLLFSVSSLTCGLAATLFAEALYLGVRTPGFVFRWHTLLALGLIEAAALAALLADRAAFSPTALASVDLLLLGERSAPFWLGIVSIGLALPVLAHLLFRFLPLEALILVSAVCVLVGGFYIRHCVVNAGLLTPLFPVT
ncbi:MAG: polysulfide reductase NrfD [Coriobacteriales bacterium]|nr:polysulfide reductase NrfD [Coriobacteriales bacterium]